MVIIYHHMVSRSCRSSTQFPETKECQQTGDCLLCCNGMGSRFCFQTDDRCINSKRVYECSVGVDCRWFVLYGWCRIVFLQENSVHARRLAFIRSGWKCLPCIGDMEYKNIEANGKE